LQACIVATLGGEVGGGFEKLENLGPQEVIRVEVKMEQGFVGERRARMVLEP
jgi:hypothetical protein